MLRSYDEEILNRLAWFVSVPGFVLMIVGLRVVALAGGPRRCGPVVLPTLLLFPLYGYTASNSTRLLWWSRRYIPTVLPGIVILVALAVAFFAVWRWRGRSGRRCRPWPRSPGSSPSSSRSPSRSGRTTSGRGSFALTQEIADLSEGRDGRLPLGVRPGLLRRGDAAARDARVAAARAAVRAAAQQRQPRARRQRAHDGHRPHVARFPGQPVFVVADKGELPAGIDPARVVPVLDKQTSLPMWEESNLERPDEAREIPVHVSVWRVR
jgi:hypothetical protein